MRSRLPGPIGQSIFQSRNANTSENQGPPIAVANITATRETNQSNCTSKLESNGEHPTRRKSVSSTINTNRGNKSRRQKDDEKKYLVSNDYTIKVPKYSNNGNVVSQEDTKKLTTDLESIVKEQQQESKLKKTL